MNAGWGIIESYRWMSYSDDAEEGMTAFIEKKKPVFRGR